MSYRSEVFKRVLGLMPGAASMAPLATKNLGHPSEWALGETEDGRWYLRFAGDSSVRAFEVADRTQGSLLMLLLVTAWCGLQDDWTPGDLTTMN